MVAASGSFVHVPHQGITTVMISGCSIDPLPLLIIRRMMRRSQIVGTGVVNESSCWHGDGVGWCGMLSMITVSRVVPSHCKRPDVLVQKIIRLRKGTACITVLEEVLYSVGDYEYCSYYYHYYSSTTAHHFDVDHYYDDDDDDDVDTLCSSSFSHHPHACSGVKLWVVR